MPPGIRTDVLINNLTKLVDCSSLNVVKLVRLFADVHQPSEDHRPASEEPVVESGQLAGSRGGTVASYDNVERYLNNTEFIGLVQAGWIGSRGVTSDDISEVIRNAMEEKRSLIMAEAEGPPATGR